MTTETKPANDEALKPVELANLLLTEVERLQPDKLTAIYGAASLLCMIIDGQRWGGWKGDEYIGKVNLKWNDDLRPSLNDPEFPAGFLGSAVDEIVSKIRDIAEGEAERLRKEAAA